MTQLLTPSLIALCCIIPLIIIFKKPSVAILPALLVILVYHMVYSTFLLFPIEFGFQFPNTSFNWTGKIFAILFSASFYFMTKEKLKDHNFLTPQMVKGSSRKILTAGGITLIIMCLLTVLFSKDKLIDLERLAFQLTMPGIDEELWRGILLGLMIPLVKDGKFKLGHPALWATTIIFALVHSLYLKDGNPGFAADAFIVTGALGYILGWTILKSRSILPAIILHNLINFSTNFIEMFML